MKRFGGAWVAVCLAMVSEAGAAVVPKTPHQVSIHDGLVSVRVTDAPLVEVVQELGRRGGFEVIADPSDEARVSASFDGVTLREAIRRVCKSAGYIEVLDPQTGRVTRLVLTPSKASPVARVAERQEPLSPRGVIQEPPIEPDLQPEPDAEPEPQAAREQQPPPARAAPPEPQVFPPAFGADERADDRRRRRGDDD